MKPYYSDEWVNLYHGDCLDVLRTLPDASVDSVVTDPPYGLEFMGKEWDSFRPGTVTNRGGAAPGRSTEAEGRWVAVEYGTAKRRTTLTCDGCGKSDKFKNPHDCPPDTGWTRIYLDNSANAAATMRAFQAWCELWARECLRVLKPGGHMLAFGGTRTSHRLACAIEDAGFEIRDSIAWLYGSGFAKGGLLGNRPGVAWCSCGENPIPYRHADNADLPRVRNDIHQAPVAREASQDDVLLPPMQRRGAGPRVGDTRPQGPRGLVAGSNSLGAGEDDGRAEPGMGGRDIHRAGQGLPNGTDAGPSASASERLRGRAPAGDGVPNRSPGDAPRGSAPHQQGPGGQSAGESEALPRPHESLDDGARRGRMGCPRCGGTPNEFRGFSTTLKPAFEPVVVARKPLIGTVAQNIQAHGTGALNVDGCRIGTSEAWAGNRAPSTSANGFGPGDADGWTGSWTKRSESNPAGRWPANVCLDEHQAAALDEQTADLQSAVTVRRNLAGQEQNAHGIYGSRTREASDDVTYGDQGGASRFFYTAKAGSDERPTHNGTSHPTVKPLALMRWLVRLVTPPGGTVLEPFAGSGTTAEACLLERFHCIAIEREADYLPLIVQRINRRRDPIAYLTDAGHDLGLFADEETA